MKTFFVLFLVLFFASCGKSDGGSHVEAAETQTGIVVEEVQETGKVPVQAITFDVNPVLIGFTRSQEEKIHKAADLIRKVVASQAFKNRVLNYTYKGKKQFVDNQGLSNAQIYRRILDGAEIMGNTRKNNTMDLEIQLYTDNNSNTIGYTYPNIIRIFMNRKYFNNFKPHQVADNMMHEWLHKIGFTHAVEPTPERPHSVPYAIGYIVKDLASRYKQ
jgi:hypothetical protein